MKELEEDNIDQVILDIGNKLTGQEIWYWESLVHLYREYKRRFENLTKEHTDTITRNEDYRERIDRTIKELNEAYSNIDNCKNVNYIHEAFKQDLLEILKGSDKE